MTLELQRFCTLDCVNLIYSSKDRSLCVLSFDTTYCCISETIPKLHVAKVMHLKSNKLEFDCD